MSFTKVKKGVCAAKGFVANGLNCGLNSDKNKNDLALVLFRNTVSGSGCLHNKQGEGRSYSGDKGTP